MSIFQANPDLDSRRYFLQRTGVGLVDRAMLAGLPPELGARLDALLTDAGR